MDNAIAGTTVLKLQDILAVLDKDVFVTVFHKGTIINTYDVKRYKEFYVVRVGINALIHNSLNCLKIDISEDFKDTCTHKFYY